MQTIHIFRAGTHRAMSGDEIRFTDADLTDIAEGYNPATSEAPIVIGHPTHDAPAYGWVTAVEAKGGELYCQPKQVEPAFAEMVSQGRFKKVSAAFYTPDAPANPTPGQYYLRHVGFLGAQPPAVKGLAPVAFADGDTQASDHIVTVEMMNESTGLLASALDAIAKALATLSPQPVKKDEDEVQASDDTPSTAGGGEGIATPLTQPETPVSGAAAASVEPQFSEADLARERAELETEKARFKEQRRHDETEAFVRTLVADGRILPTEKPGIAAFMDGLDGSNSVTFAEGDETRELGHLDYFRAFLEGLAPRIDFAEHSGEDNDGADQARLSPRDIAEKAQAYAQAQKAQGVDVSTARAVRHIAGVR